MYRLRYIYPPGIYARLVLSIFLHVDSVLQTTMKRISENLVKISPIEPEIS